MIGPIPRAPGLLLELAGAGFARSGLSRGVTCIDPAEGRTVGDQIADFCDGFLDRRMVGYRLRGNRRLQLASRFVRTHIRRDSNVLDVGCGIGITTEAVARKARRGRL